MAREPGAPYTLRQVEAMEERKAICRTGRVICELRNASLKPVAHARSRIIIIIIIGDNRQHQQGFSVNHGTSSVFPGLEISS